MFGLVVLGIVLGYLTVALGATALTIYAGKKTGDTVRRRWTKGAVVALVFYLIPFWVFCIFKF